MKSGIEHAVPTVPVTLSAFTSQELHNLTHGNAFPAEPVERQLFYRDDLHKWAQYRNGNWHYLASEDYVDTEVATAVSDHADLTTGTHGVGPEYISRVPAISERFVITTTAANQTKTLDLGPRYRTIYLLTVFYTHPFCIISGTWIVSFCLAAVNPKITSLQYASYQQGSVSVTKVGGGAEWQYDPDGGGKVRISVTSGADGAGNNNAYIRLIAIGRLI